MGQRLNRLANFLAAVPPWVRPQSISLTEEACREIAEEWAELGGKDVDEMERGLIEGRVTLFKLPVYVTYEREA